MKCYFSSSLMWGKPFTDILQEASRLGAAGVEIWAEQFWLQQESPAHIFSLKQELGLELTLHACSWDINIHSINKGIREQSVREISKSFALAKQLDAHNVTVHPGRQSTPGLMNHSLNVYIELAMKAAEHDCTLSLEQMEETPKELFCEPEQMNALSHFLPEEVKITFDTAHVPLTINPYDYLKKLERVNKIHLSDTSLDKYHVALGDGRLHLPDILSILAKTSLPVVLEGLDQSDNNDLLHKHLDYLQKSGLHVIPEQNRSFVSS